MHDRNNESEHNKITQFMLIKGLSNKQIRVLF